MIAVIDNKNIQISDVDPQTLKYLVKELSYQDKSKLFQIKRMKRCPFLYSAELMQQLKEESRGCLANVDGSSITMSSSFYYLLSSLNIESIEDNRRLTGKDISLPFSKKPDPLRDYQQEAVDDMVNNYRGIVNFATGLGKTLVAVHAIKNIGKRALVVCPSESIAKQFYDELCTTFGSNKVGFYGDGKKKISQLTVGIAASVTRNIDQFKAQDLGLVIVDEAHHTSAPTFYAIMDGLGDVGKIFGLTATDFRSDGKDIMMEAACGPTIIRRDIRWGVENGWLSKPYFIVREMSTAGKDYRDDKIKNYKAHVLNNTLMKSRIESDARGMMDAGMSVLILVDEVAHGQELSHNLGIPFATGKDTNSIKYIEQLNKGEVRGLVGTDGKISEGTNTKNIDVLILANFPGSVGPVTQCIGRALRKQGNKDKAYILDYVPLGSEQLTRHAWQRVEFYRTITDNVKVIR